MMLTTVEPDLSMKMLFSSDFFPSPYLSSFINLEPSDTVQETNPECTNSLVTIGVVLRILVCYVCCVFCLPITS